MAGATAVISAKAEISASVKIGNFCVIGDNVSIEDGVEIGDFCVIGHTAGGEHAGKRLSIGKGSVIRSHSVLYEGSHLGPNLQTGHHVLIREGTVAGEGLSVGSYSDIEGDCTLGDFVRCHSYVHIGRGSKVGNFVWLYSLVTLTNDPLPPSDIQRPVTIHDGAVICVGTTILPGSVVKMGAMVPAGSVVQGEIPAGALWAEGRGLHVSYLCDTESMTRHPWTRHLLNRYPDRVHDRLKELEKGIMSSRSSGN